MDVDTYQGGGGGGLFDKPQRRQHRHRHRHRRLQRQAAWKRTLAGVSIIAAALVVGGLAIGAAYIFTRPPAEAAPAATDDEPKPTTGDPRLVGRWLTDLDATIEQMKEKTPLTDQQELQIRRQRQISVLTFTDTTLTIQIKGKPDTQPYHLVSSGGDRLVLRTWFVASKSEEEIRIRFVGPDICWVEVPKFKLVECYRKVKPPGPVADPGAVPDPLGKEP
jgi:hypothetical protein